MRRRTGTILVTALLTGAAAVLGGGIPGADAATPAPPMTGNVAGSLDGTSTFKPFLGYSPGIGDGKVSPDRDATWKAVADLVGCTGSQAGGSPKKPGPIATGQLLVKATAVDHDCQKVTDSGLSLSRFRVRWRDAAGRSLTISLGSTGAVTVDGLYNGWPYADPFDPGSQHPGYVSPGIITLHGSGTVDPASKVFPGEPFSFTAVADQTIEGSMQFPCSYQTPPLAMGVRGFDFHAVNGPSTLSIG
jgi:hypothetical protein